MVCFLPFFKPVKSTSDLGESLAPWSSVMSVDAQQAGVCPPASSNHGAWSLQGSTDFITRGKSANTQFLVKILT